MKTLVKKSLTMMCAALAVSMSANASVTIDDFTSGGYSNSITGGYSIASQLGTMLGGERDTGMYIQSNPLGQYMDLLIMPGPGLSITSNGTLTDSALVLDYDGIGDEDGNDPMKEGPGLGSLNWSNMTDIRIDFLTNDLPQLVGVAIGSYGMGYSLAVVSVPGLQYAPFSVNVPLSSFSPYLGLGADLSDVDRVAFIFDTIPGGDFALRGMSVVPEPASLIALSTGLVGLLARRRRKQA